MFNFFSMMDNYEDRKVDRYEADGMIIDTASVTDGNQPYETGICHPEYNDGDWVIVEAYDTREEAQKGHDKWVARMSSGNLPSSLKDCGNSGVSQLLDMVGGDMEFPRIIEGKLTMLALDDGKAPAKKAVAKSRKSTVKKAGTKPAHRK